MIMAIVNGVSDGDVEANAGGGGDLDDGDGVMVMVVVTAMAFFFWDRRYVDQCDGYCDGNRAVWSNYNKNMISNDNNSELRVSVVKLLNNNIDDNVYMEEYINQECFWNPLQ